MLGGARGAGTSYSPPPNFALVAEGIYRSAYPCDVNVAYLCHVGIKTIALLSIEALPNHVVVALQDPLSGDTGNRGGEDGQSPIRIIELASMRGWQLDSLNSGDDFSHIDVTRALDIAINTQWHPVLFACPTGEHQTSVVVGCMRRIQHWSLAAIFSECELFANLLPTVRTSVLSFIEAWLPESYTFSEVDVYHRSRAIVDLGEPVVGLKKRRVRGWRRPSRDQHARRIMESSTCSEDSWQSDDSSHKNTSVPELEVKDAMAGRSHRWDARRLTSSTHCSTAETAEARPPKVPTVVQADWFREAAKLRQPVMTGTCNRQRGTSSGGISESLEATESLSLQAPHDRYLGVRNPPALDERSTFSKESIVEEDDD